MKIFEKIKAFFFGKKTKALPENGIEIDKISLMAITEKNPEKAE